MAPQSRNPSNRALPKYWRLHKGSYSYRVPPHMRHLHGGKTEISLGQSLSAAYQKFATLYQTEENITLMRELFDRYRMEVVTEYESANTRDSKNRSLDRLRAAMGDNLVSTANSQAIYIYKNHIGKTRSKTIANRDLECLSHVFTMAIEWGAMKGHPMTGKQVTKFSLTGRDRYVEDWELDEWAKVANPFLVVYAKLKGVTGLRQQDLLTLERKNITDTHLVSVNIKTGKKLRFPLYNQEGEPTTVRIALDEVDAYYRSQLTKKLRSRHPQALPPVVSAPWVFYTRKGGCYYDMENRRSPGFKNIWGRSMKKALAETSLTDSFREHDLRAKVASDMDTDIQAQEQLAHSDAAVTRKHYRRKGTVVQPARGFFGGSAEGAE